MARTDAARIVELEAVYRPDGLMRLYIQPASAPQGSLDGMRYANTEGLLEAVMETLGALWRTGTHHRLVWMSEGPKWEIIFSTDDCDAESISGLHQERETARRLGQ